MLEADFEIGHYLKERVVPRAVLYFTGEYNDDELCNDSSTDNDGSTESDDLAPSEEDCHIIGDGVE